MKLQREAAESRERKEDAFRKYAPFAAGIAIIGTMTLSPFALGQPRPARSEQCSASVQSGSITSYHSRGRGVHLVSSPLMRGGYISVTIPDSYVSRLTTEAGARPESERSAYVRDAVHRNIETAITRVGSGDRATFDCAPTSGASASVSIPADAGTREQPAPVSSGDAGTRQAPPVVSADAAPSASADAGPRRRTISPGQ